MFPRAVIPLLVVLIAGTAFLPTPVFVLGDAATAGTLACAPGQPCSMPEACEVSALAAVRPARHDAETDGCCSAELPSTAPGDLPPVDDDARSTVNRAHPSDV